MPRIHGYRERRHQALWTAIVLLSEPVDCGALLSVDGGMIVTENKHALAHTRTLDLWEVVLDYGELPCAGA